MDESTLEKLKAAFAGESQANRKYLAFAEKAEKEGFKNVALLFKAIAYAETVHALNHFEIFGVSSTLENLKAAMAGEHYEVNEMYPEFKKVAEAANEKQAIRSFSFALEAEKIHEQMYSDAIKAVESGKDFNIEGQKISICTVCGHTIFGDAPDECPICKAKKEKFKVFS
ncbi:MAG: rubrerythrin family protein [Promethearchaeota archaeon]